MEKYSIFVYFLLAIVNLLLHFFAVVINKVLKACDPKVYIWNLMICKKLLIWNRQFVRRLYLDAIYLTFKCSSVPLFIWYLELIEGQPALLIMKLGFLSCNHNSGSIKHHYPRLAEESCDNCIMGMGARWAWSLAQVSTCSGCWNNDFYDTIQFS